METPGGATARAALIPTLRLLRRFGPLVLLAGAILWALQSGLAQQVTLQSLAEHRLALGAFVEAHPVRSAAIFLAMDVAVTALSLPGSGVLSLAAGLMFGPWLGGAAALIAASTGSTMFFLVCRGAAGGLLTTRIVPPRFAARLAALEDSVRANAFVVLLSLRLAPVMPLPLTNLAAALFGVRLKAFLPATLIGMAPASLVFAGLGAALGSWPMGAGAPGSDFFFQPQVAWPLAGLMALAAGPLAFGLARRWLGRGNPGRARP